MFSYIRSFFVCPVVNDECECADAIGFHAIYDKRYHNVRPTTLGSAPQDDRSCVPTWSSYTREHPVES